MTTRARLLACAAVAWLAACSDDTPAHEGGWPPPDPGIGQSLEANAACLACHEELAPRWQLASSHGQLLDCAHCHGTLGTPGPGHSDARACGDCHSNGSHPAGATCLTCHEPHGTTNAFLVRETISIEGAAVPVHLTAPEGASADGLARAGTDGGTPGTGVCEVCHATTRYYNRAGDGLAHDAGWCARCHMHQNGFLFGVP